MAADSSQKLTLSLLHQLKDVSTSTIQK